MVETESTVIGCFILDYKACREAGEEIQPSWFEMQEYAVIMAQIRALEIKGICPDSMTLISGLDEQTKAEVVRCAQLVPSLSNFPHYVQMLKGEWRQRTVMDKLKAILWDEKTPVEGVIESLRALVAEQDDITANGQREVGEKFLDVMAEFYTGLYEQATRHLSGYPTFDKTIGGLLPGTVCVIAARSGQGKTDFSLSLMMRYAAAGLKVVYYSMEMTNTQLMTRLAAQMTRINSVRIRDKALSEAEKLDIARAFGTVKGNRHIRMVEGKPSVDVLKAHCKAYRPDVVFIDHLGLMKMPSCRTRTDAVAETTRAIKALALETGIAVVELVQMNRDVEKRGNKRPMLSDLKESGTIEEDADYVLFLQAQKGDHTLTGNEAWKSTVYVEKNRHGGTGVMQFAWRPQHSMFTAVAGE